MKSEMERKRGREKINLQRCEEGIQNYTKSFINEKRS